MNRNIRSFSFLGKIIPVLLVVFVLASACAPAANPDPLAPTPTTKAPDPTTMPTTTPTNTPVPQSSGPADAAKLDLAKILGIDTSKITILSQEEVDWPDSCLGVAVKGVMCAQVITPGYKIILQAQGQTYEYHTNLSGSAFALATKPLPRGLEVVITYHREGGIAGFCDDIVIYASGLAKVTSCKFNKETEVTLTAAQKQTINQWLKSFQGFNYEHTDPATADAMTITLKFSGQGQTQPSDADIQAMLSLLSAIAAQ